MGVWGFRGIRWGIIDSAVPREGLLTVTQSIPISLQVIAMRGGGTGQWKICWTPIYAVSPSALVLSHRSPLSHTSVLNSAVESKHLSLLMVSCARVHVCSVAQFCLTHWTHRLLTARLFCPGDFPGKSAGAGCHFLLQGIFPTQGLNLGRQILYHWATSFHTQVL